MKKNNALAAVLISLMVVISACLSQDQVPGVGPAFSSALTVQLGPTPGPSVEGELSVFSMQWNAAEGAEWYEVRMSTEPITASNWENCLSVDTVMAGDSSIVTAQVAVQPEVYTNTCIGCGQCVEVCPQDAMELIDGRAVINLDLCTACGECVRVCPVKAISNSSYGEQYYFAVRAMGNGNSPSAAIAATTSSYRLRYMNDKVWCGDCAYECFILLDTCGPGCPVDAISFTPDWSTPPADSGLIHIDYDLCIDCGQCWIQCHEYGLWSIKREVVGE